MKYGELLDILDDQPVFASSLLRVGDIDPTDVASQLSRWVASGRLLRLRRGVYALPASYRKRDPHPFEVANLLAAPSYVSLESALSFHGLIPEAVFATTSITTARAATFETGLGRYICRHVSAQMMWGYTLERLDPSGRTTALVARAEKALLDLAYLRPGADSLAFLRGLRLERLDSLDLDVLGAYADRTGKPKLQRTAALLASMAQVRPGEGATS